MHHVKKLSIEQTPVIAATAPFTKCCLMAGGRLENSGNTCVTSSDASHALFELFANIKGVGYSD